jgi:2-methylaconitate cis-trans-isomerase PrpF
MNGGEGTMQRKTKFPCTIMRGGTSKGIFLMEEDLPRDPGLRDRIILAIFGSPDIRQINGLGGADSLTSKLALIASPKTGGRDVDYTFGAVGIDKPFVDYSANCGNISSAVGPFVIEKGWVRAEEPCTTVRIFNTNTRKMVHAKVPIKKGRVISEGDYAMDGVPGTGAKIELSFLDPGGAATGKLIPTGKVVDEIVLDSGERFQVTVVDAGNPTAFVHAEALGLRGTELPEDFDQNVMGKIKLEGIRKKVGELIGIPVNPSIPKIAFLAPPQDFKTIAGGEVRKDEVDLVARVMAMGKMHKTFAITAGIPAAAAAVIPGSVVSGCIDWDRGKDLKGEAIRRKVTIGHPSGKFEVEVLARQEGDQVRILSCTIGRTARKIMEGRVYIPGKVYSFSG